MLTRPFLDRWGRRLILAFGIREITQRQIIEEIVLGCWLLIPLGIFVGFITIRWFTVRYNPFPTRFVRSDIWTTCVIFIVGDIIMELFLLPSLQCVPLPMYSSTQTMSSGDHHHAHHSHSRHHHQQTIVPSYDISMFMYTLQFYNLGPLAIWANERDMFPCPLLVDQAIDTGSDNDDITTSSSSTIIPEHLILFTPLATACLLSLRLIFICIGVHIGETLAFPICLTGGIACGKSTVGYQLTHLPSSRGSTNTTNDPDDRKKQQQQDNTSGRNSINNRHQHSSSSPPKSPSKKHRKTLKKPPSNNNLTSTEDMQSGGTNQDDVLLQNSDGIVDDDEEREGTVYMICADSIAHEILLPPSVLASSPSSSSSSAAAGDKYTVLPSDSVYNQLVDAFGEYDIFVDSDNDNNNDGNDDTDRNDDSDDDYDGEGYDDDMPLSPSHRGGSGDTSKQPLIDRRKLGILVFQDRNLRRTLNSITHPRISLVLFKRLLYGLFWSGNDFCCADVPLLFESGKLRWLFGWVICVTCPRDMQLARMKIRNPDWTEQECQARIDSQWPISQKEALSDSVIENTTTLHELRRRVEEVRNDLMQRRYGLIGMSLMQMLLLIGGSTTIAVSSKWYTSSMSS